MSTYSAGTQFLVGGVLMILGGLMLVVTIALFYFSAPTWAILTMIVSMFFLGIGKLFLDSALASDNRYDNDQPRASRYYERLWGIVALIGFTLLVLALIFSPDFRERFGEVLIRLSD